MDGSLSQLQICSMGKICQQALLNYEKENVINSNLMCCSYYKFYGKHCIPAHERLPARRAWH